MCQRNFPFPDTQEINYTLEWGTHSGGEGVGVITLYKLSLFKGVRLISGD